MEFPALEKFIKRMNIEVNYDIERSFITSNGKRYACVGIHAFYRGEENYTQYHCYETTNSGHITYEEGNEVKGVNDGIFSYLGHDKLIEKYFEEKSRNIAKEHFEKNYLY